MMFDPLKSSVLQDDMERIFHSRHDFDALRGKSVYLTGASGMLASYFIYFLIWLNEKENFHLEIFAEVRNPKRAVWRFGIYAEKPYFHLVEHDVCTPVEIHRHIDYLFHAASLASPQYYGSNPVETMLPNVVGTNEILKFARICGAESVLFFSSAAVYGTVSHAGEIKETQVGFLDHLAAGSVYGESKRCGEALCGAYFREFGVPVKIVRFGHTYGPTLDLNRDKRAFSEFVANILRGENILLKSDGSEKRAFCYLSDAAEALLKILLDGQNGECYNLVNRKEFVSIRELSQTLVSLFPEKRLKVVFGTRNEKGYAPLAQTSAVVCNTDKLAALGATFSVGIHEGFLKTIRYFEEMGNFPEKS